MSKEDELKEYIELLKKQLDFKTQDLSQFKSRLSQAHEKMIQLSQNLEDDIHALKTIQNLLMPSELPHIPGFKFSTKIVQGQKSGGDYFDIFNQNKKFRFGFLVSSCSSYGLSSLFLSVLLQWGAQFQDSRISVDKVFKVLAENLYASLKPSDVLHLFYAHMNRKTLQIDYGLVGDISVFHIQKEGVSVLENSPPFNRSQTLDILTKNLNLRAKETLLVCSPGVFSLSHHQTGELYSKQRVMSVVKEWNKSDVHDLRNRLFYDMQSFVKKEKFDTDVLVFVFHVKGETLHLAENSHKS